jgi:GAF domain-containing protein
MPTDPNRPEKTAAVSVDELARKAESLSTLSERVAFLSEAARVLSSSIQYEETFQCLSLLIVPRVADWATINRLLPDGSFERVAHHHADPVFDERLQRMKPSPPPKNAKVGIAHVLKSGESILVPDHCLEYLNTLEAAGWSPQLISVLREMRVVSAMAVPMIRDKNQIIGGLTFFTTERSGRHYDDEDLQMAKELATLAAMAIHNAALHRHAVDEVQKMRVLTTMRDEYIRKQIHDIRTPLTALSLLIELIGRSPPVPERIQSLVKRARENIDRASQMLGNLRAKAPTEKDVECAIRINGHTP